MVRGPKYVNRLYYQIHEENWDIFDEEALDYQLAPLFRTKGWYTGPSRICQKSGAFQKRKTQTDPTKPTPTGDTTTKERKRLRDVVTAISQFCNINPNASFLSDPLLRVGNTIDTHDTLDI